MQNAVYPSSVTDKQWRLIEKLLPEKKSRGRKQKDRRVILNAILYWNRTGCQWRYLPKEFGPWQTVYRVFRQWVAEGTWLWIHDNLRELVRKAAGKEPTPTAAIIDSQSVQTAGGGEERGFDAAKKVNGRKRHIAVDTLGMLLVVVHAASVQDQVGAKRVLEGITDIYRRLKVVFGDSAYGRSGLPQWISGHCNRILQTVLRPVNTKGFVICSATTTFAL